MEAKVLGYHSLTNGSKQTKLAVPRKKVFGLFFQPLFASVELEAAKKMETLKERKKFCKFSLYRILEEILVQLADPE